MHQTKSDYIYFTFIRFYVESNQMMTHFVSMPECLYYQTCFFLRPQ